MILFFPRHLILSSSHSPYSLSPSSSPPSMAGTIADKTTWIGGGERDEEREGREPRRRLGDQRVGKRRESC